ncbi:biotin carboxylase N-terminal domain-containing protein [Amycolatopsis anabasis]|uniref:biotin carboxylase N-terminal domain-containing protein n=1 Tax=Amycolatopsis anabasis TaxID=1840409 RepID=UPI00131CC95C|nr:biotin carboxylase N-terminal domain-containing protein [Amycolatopsis anabasis]
MFDRIAVVNCGEPAMRLLRAVEKLRDGGSVIAMVALHVTEEAKAAYVIDSAAARPFLGLEVLGYALVRTAVDAVWTACGPVAENFTSPSCVTGSTSR